MARDIFVILAIINLIIVLDLSIFIFSSLHVSDFVDKDHPQACKEDFESYPT